MVIFYNRWKKYNEIQLTKNKNGLKYSKNDESSTLPLWRGQIIDANNNIVNIVKCAHICL